MTTDKEGSDGGGANVLRMDAKAFRKERKPRSYPSEWKDNCKELLRLFKHHMAARFGGKYGWQRVRDLMMTTEDALEPHGVRSALLTRQDLEKWIDGITPSRLGDDKFYFVDRFLQEKFAANDPDFMSLRYDLAILKDEQFFAAKRMFNMGTRVEPSKIVYDELRKCVGVVFQTVHAIDPVRQTYLNLVFHECRPGIIRVIGFLSDQGAIAVKDSLGSLKPVFGYFLPIGLEDYLFDDRQVFGLLSLFDRSRANTMDWVGYRAGRCFLLPFDGSLKLFPLETPTLHFTHAHDNNLVSEEHVVPELVLSEELTL